MTTNDNMELRIREVAQQLFFEQGYAATSTTQIAKEVGCTQALVHYYYRTKENLFRQIFLEQVLAALNVIGRSLANEESFDRFIEQAISMYFDALSSNPRLPYFVLEELVNNPERRKYMREKFVKNPTYAMLYMQFDARLKQEQQAGHITKIDPFDLMITIASLTTKCASTLLTAKRKSSAWSKRSSNHRNNLPNMQKWYIFERFVFV